MKEPGKEVQTTQGVANHSGSGKYKDLEIKRP
jgi:hypothetical protein